MRGPWQVSICDAGDTLRFGKRIHIRRSADWFAWAEEVDRFAGPGTVWLLRKFNWPAPVPRPASVQLVIRGFPSPTIRLNDRSLPPPSGDGSFEVLPLLRASNQLAIEWDWANFNDSSGVAHPGGVEDTAVYLQIFEVGQGDHGKN